MKTRRLIAFIVIPLLFSCLPKKPESPGVEVPAGPLLQAMEQRRQSFAGLKAMASIEVAKRGGKRTLENVGIVLDGERRFRIEAFGPLGQSAFALVWDGQELFGRLPGNDRVVRQGPAALGRLFGEGLEVRDLCAILSGNIPGSVTPPAARLFCRQAGDCTLELSQGDRMRRVGIRLSPDPAGKPVLVSQAFYVSEKLVYEARYESPAEIAHYLLPMTLVIRNPDKKVQLTIVYNDAEVNIPIKDDAFVLRDEDVEGSEK